MSKQDIFGYRRTKILLDRFLGWVGEKNMHLILSRGGDKREIAKLNDYLPEGGTLACRIAKYQRAKLRSLQMLLFLERELRKCNPVGDCRRVLLKKQAGLLRACGTWLHFAYYYAWQEDGFKDEYRLIRANFCDQEGRQRFVR